VYTEISISKVALYSTLVEYSINMDVRHLLILFTTFTQDFHKIITNYDDGLMVKVFDQVFECTPKTTDQFLPCVVRAATETIAQMEMTKENRDRYAARFRWLSNQAHFMTKVLDIVEKVVQVIGEGTIVKFSIEEIFDYVTHLIGLDNWVN